MDLAALLQTTFGFETFRPNQQAVCEAAAAGQDVLLVMPTGAGKSLCYQLPALARGGTALVISPLIALMDDQAAKLTAAGLRVARIHSGLPREAANQAWFDYKEKRLDFLFVAPERFRVPRFTQLLAQHKPSLIAIDEAHCISQWGHDFRPDYRTLGDHLPALRPAPIIALTATATPVVQRDIVAQLRLVSPSLFIHGFRRSNLAIEVVEMSKPRRNGFVIDLLKPAAARPAIVYAPSRKSAEELASLLNSSLPKRSGAPELGAPEPALSLSKGLASETRVHAYHAGLDPATRDRVQTAFLTGRADVVVATIAFGMGIDKADVRTVVHLALPASVEGFYQEIGRAGRDGLPSHTVLLHSFADRRMHEFFLERDYPAAAELARVHNLLTPGLQHPDDLARRLKMDPNTLANALSKLASQGAATFDFDGQVRSTGASEWRSGYDAQLAFRRQQIDRMVAFAETPQCRMAALIRHFGDTSDGLRPCGHCDHCAPELTSASTVRSSSPEEQRHLRAILRALEATGRSTGKLFTDLAPGFRIKDRKVFDELLNALARAGLLTLTTDTFTGKDDGRQISYKKATLTHEGRFLDEGDLPVTLRDTGAEPTTHRRHLKSLSASSSTSLSSRPKRSGVKGPASLPLEPIELTPSQQHLDQQLRAWRKTLAAESGKPAFLILGDRTLTAIATHAPQTLSELARVPGIGPDKLDRYGAAFVAICRDEPVQQPGSPAGQTSPPDFALTVDRSQVARLLTPAVAMSSRPASVNGKSVVADANAARRPRLSSPPPPAPTEPLTGEPHLREQRLLAWRKHEAAHLNLPQFFVLSAATLRQLALDAPATLTELAAIPGIGSDKLTRYGPDLLTCLHSHLASPPATPASDTLSS